VNSAARDWLERGWYPVPSPRAMPPPLALRFAAAIYGAAARTRAALYDAGFLAVRRIPVPCVSVGNLSVGGTGKTPLVAWILGETQALGARPAVVSRGYGGSARRPERVPSDGGAGTAARYGDEPALLAARFPAVPVVVGRDRHAAGLVAAVCGATVVVADDAFQHRRLGRDLDIAIVDASRGMGNGRLLPAGPLREPPAALSRADLVVINRIGLAADPGAVRAAVGRLAPRAALAEADLDFAGFEDARSGAPVELARGTGVYAFSGVANPGSFRWTLESLGLRIAGWEVFPDHHAYRPGELGRLALAAERSGAAAAVTTAKDAVRIHCWEGMLPLYRAEVKLVMIRGREQLWEALKSLAAGGRG
jgi:tetraacyldisaccharide 4'-kinase